MLVFTRQESSSNVRWVFLFFSTDVKSVPVLAGLHSGNTLSKMFESLHEQASRVKNIKRFHAFGDSGLEQDDYTECLNHLLDSKESFEDHYC